MRLKNITGLILVTFLITNQTKANHFEELTRTFEKVLNLGDSVKFSQFFEENARLFHVENESVTEVPLNNFYPVLKKFNLGEYRETFTKIETQISQNSLITVNVSFDFYINETFSHKGIDQVVWSKQKDGNYKIINVYSGSIKSSFSKAIDKNDLKVYLDQQMNKWHEDVATYQLEAYFDFMTEDFIFLGTDPTERWDKETFYEFCKPYFEKKSTWDFKTINRNWYLNDDKDIAWFEESLDTWMDVCRGSGVLKKINGEWKIAHYNLTVLIENEKMDKFLKLRKK